MKQASVCVERNTQAVAYDTRMSESHHSEKRLDVVSDYTTFAIGFRKLCVLIEEDWHHLLQNMAMCRYNSGE